MCFHRVVKLTKPCFTGVKMAGTHYLSKVKGKGKPLRAAARAACREPKHGSGSTSKAPRCSQRNGPLSFAPLSPPVFGRFPDLAILDSEFPSNPVISERAVGAQMDTEITRNPRKQPGQYGCVREPPEYSGAKLNENSDR